jgi:hypothetical protein
VDVSPEMLMIYSPCLASSSVKFYLAVSILGCSKEQKGDEIIMKRVMKL